jgi:hypothetical protein
VAGYEEPWKAFVPRIIEGELIEDAILEPEEMEHLKETIAPWRIESVLDENGGRKVFSRQITIVGPGHEDQISELTQDYGSDALKGIFGGYEGNVQAQGQLARAGGKNYCLVTLTTEGGPITLDDISKVTAAEDFLQDSGYIIEIE